MEEEDYHEHDIHEDEETTWLGHINTVLVTSFVVLSVVVAYILYIVHLYDTGAIGGKTDFAKRTKVRGRRKKYD